MENSEAFSKLSRFCAYQERCLQDVKEKIKELGISQEQAPLLIAQLQEEDFLSDERFARSFAVGKFGHLHWGRRKIEYELRQRHLPNNLIAQALEAIDEDDYRQCLQTLLEKKKRSLPAKTLPAKAKQQLMSYAVQKGYEMSLVQELLRNDIGD